MFLQTCFKLGPKPLQVSSRENKHFDGFCIACESGPKAAHVVLLRLKECEGLSSRFSPAGHFSIFGAMGSKSTTDGDWVTARLEYLARETEEEAPEISQAGGFCTGSKQSN